MAAIFEKRGATWTKEDRPRELIDLGSFCYVVSNLDHIINEQIADKLRSGNCWAGYPAMGFFGEVWFDLEDDLFKCFIRRLGTFPGTIVAETLQEIIDVACEKYGYD